MSQLFNTVQMPAMVELLTYSGSAFATNESGEQIFINSRIVERCKLTDGLEVVVHALPNYEDKRQSIPWRAMRVDVPRAISSVAVSVSAPEAVGLTTAPRSAVELDLEILGIINSEDGYLTTTEIAELAATDAKTAGNSCNRLFIRGKICKAEVHAGPGQGRASFLLWGKGTDAFV